MSVTAIIHTTAAYIVHERTYGYQLRERRYNFLIEFNGNGNRYSVAELIQREKHLTAAHRKILNIVRRKFGV